MKEDLLGLVLSPTRNLSQRHDDDSGSTATLEQQWDVILVLYANEPALSHVPSMSFRSINEATDVQFRPIQSTAMYYNINLPFAERCLLWSLLQIGSKAVHIGGPRMTSLPLMAQEDQTFT
jgi:hypothetical protein